MWTYLFFLFGITISLLPEIKYISMLNVFLNNLPGIQYLGSISKLCCIQKCVKMNSAVKRFECVAFRKFPVEKHITLKPHSNNPVAAKHVFNTYSQQGLNKPMHLFSLIRVFSVHLRLLWTFPLPTRDTVELDSSFVSLLARKPQRQVFIIHRSCVAKRGFFNLHLMHI